jgi:hypothetical protein
VINLSLGPDAPVSNTTIGSAVEQAAQKGAVVVFSAGNNGGAAAPSYGGNALVVAATGPSGALASYSQHGAGVSVAAPGGQPTSGGSCSTTRCVTSLYPGNQYAVAAGTSMAAPHVAGLAALLLQQSPGRSASEVMQRIEATAHPLAGAGAGLVDVAAALGIRTVAPTHRAAVARRTTAPRPKAVARVRRPRPAVVAPTPRVTAAPAKTTAPPAVVAPTPVATPPTQPLADPPLQHVSNDIPLPLAGAAGALLGLAATGVLVQALRR